MNSKKSYNKKKKVAKKQQSLSDFIVFKENEFKTNYQKILIHRDKYPNAI